MQLFIVALLLAAHPAYANVLKSCKQPSHKPEEVHNLKQDYINNKNIENFVGFTAYHGSEAFYSAGSIVSFPNVITSYGPSGSTYDPATSTFHCGVPGIYYFSHEIAGQGDDDTWTGIEVGGTVLTYAHATATGGSESAATSVLVYCANEDVRIQAFSDSHVRGDRYCTFTGFLVQLETPQVLNSAENLENVETKDRLQNKGLKKSIESSSKKDTSTCNNTSLQKQLDVITTKFKDMETKMAIYDEENLKLKQELYSMVANQDQLNVLMTKFEDMQNKMAVYHEENLKLKQEVTIQRNSSKVQNNFVGFFVYHEGEGHYGNGETVKYANVVTNSGPDGTQYDPTTGIFHCGTPGFYFFTFSFVGLYDTNSDLSINVDGVTYAIGHATQVRSQASTNSCVIQCSNQDVKISVVNAAHVQHGIYTTFSGYLLALD